MSQKPSEFLANGTQEEQALINLFKELSPNAMISLVSEFISTITTQSGTSSKCSLAGRFPRICLLVRSTGALENHDNLEASAHIIENALLSALCSMQLATDGASQAMLLTLARFFFSPKDVTANSVRAYEKWFLNVLKSAPKPSEKHLLESLKHLVPLEPLRYLKCHIRCFRRVPSWMELSRNYVALARTRVKDLDTARSRANGSPARDPGADADAKKAAAEEVCKYVADFHHGDGKSVPPSLVRQMNFHRYNFRNKILPTLVAPDANPPLEIVQREFARGGIREFDRRRIALIKILAYERKDRTITKDEADECIPKIKAHMCNRDSGSRKAPIVSKALIEISEKSALSEMFEEFCNASGCRLDFDCDGDFINADAPLGVEEEEQGMLRWKKACKLLTEKLVSLEDLAQGSADVLQLIADHVQISAAAHDPFNVQPNGVPVNELERNQHAQLWVAVKPWMVRLITRVLCRNSLCKLWETLKMQTVASLCLQSSNLSVKQIIGIAVFMYAVVVCSEAIDRNGLPFLQTKNGGSLTHLVTAAAESLPLDFAQHVLNSTRFAVTYIMLVVSSSQVPVVRPFATPVQGPDGNMHLSENDQDPLASTRLPGELVKIVHWVLCAPWRLHSLSVNVRKQMEADISTHDLVTVLKKALSVTQVLQVFKCKRFGIEDWLLLEMRTGWGRPDEVANILNKFRVNESSGITIVKQVACMIARCTVQGASYPSWIVLGLAEYASGAGCFASSEKRTESLSRMVDECFQVGGPDASLILIQIAKSLPAELYFAGESVSYVYMHIEQALSPSVWPFSHAMVRFLLSAINANQVPSDDVQLLAQTPPATLVADLAHYSSLSLPARRCYEEQLNTLDSSWSALHSQVKTFRKVFEMLQSHGRESVDDTPALGTQALGTQAPGNGLSDAQRAVQQYPETLALGILRTAANGGSFAISEVGARIEWLVGVLGGTITADVLDVAADVAAQLPVARARCSPSGLCSDIEMWAAPILQEVLRCRIRLCTSAQTPYWIHGGLTPCNSANLPFFVHRVRQMLGLVVDCDGAEEENRAVATNGLQSGRPPKRPRRQYAECASMLHMAWHTRIAAAFAELSDDVLEETWQFGAPNNLETGLLSMLVTAIENVRTVKLSVLAECLRKLRHSTRSEAALASLISGLDTSLCVAIERSVKICPVHADLLKRLRVFLPHIEVQSSNTNQHRHIYEDDS